jgi:hypothetical protein
MPGSPPACHPKKGIYQHIAGPPLTNVNTITPEERAILFAAARSFDRAVPGEPSRSSGTVAQPGGLRPGDDYNARGPDWSEIMEPHGWYFGRQRGEVRYVRRPGKDDNGWSATVGYCKAKGGTALLAVFSTNAHPFPGPCSGKNCSVHSKFDAYTRLNHDGDYAAAARALVAQGYGEQQRATGRTGVRRPPAVPSWRPRRRPTPAWTEINL